MDYLASAKNITGCTLVAVGLGLHGVGLFGPFWPAVLVALYVVGALLAPAPKRRPPGAVPGSVFDAGQVTHAMSFNQRMAQGRVPPQVMVKVLGIQRQIQALLPHALEFPTGSEDLFVIQRTATDYLPTALQAYLSLPPDFATRTVVQDGKTPLQVLLDQLDLIDSRMAEVADAIHRKDSDRLLANGRFLEERFGRGSSDLRLPGGSG